MSEVILMQTINCVCHLDQRYIMKIYNYSVKKIFNNCQINNNLIKVIFNMIIKLNNSLFKLLFNENKKKINLNS